jgi:hypothetical protein
MPVLPVFSDCERGCQALALLFGDPDARPAQRRQEGAKGVMVHRAKQQWAGMSARYYRSGIDEGQGMAVKLSRNLGSTRWMSGIAYTTLTQQKGDQP